MNGANPWQLLALPALVVLDACVLLPPKPDVDSGITDTGYVAIGTEPPTDWPYTDSSTADTGYTTVGTMSPIESGETGGTGSTGDTGASALGPMPKPR